jgi:hypothetical protein
MGGKGGGGGGQTKVPPWAQNALQYLIRDPFNSAGSIPGGGLFGDISAGQNAMPGKDIYGGLSGIPAMAASDMPWLTNAARTYGQGAGNANANLAMMGYGGAKQSNDLNAMLPQFMQASNAYGGKVNSLLSGGPGTPGGVGPQGSRAADMAAMFAKDTGPDGELYKRTLDLLTPQVNAAYASHGLGQTGMAAKAQGDTASRLADQFAQRANTERSQFLQNMVGGEGAAASMTGALGSQAVGLGGIGAQNYGTQMQGALQAMGMPANLFSQFQAGLGGGIGNMSQSAGLNMTPLQATQGAGQLLQSSYGMPMNIAGQAYDVTRAPELAMLQASAGAAPLGSPPRGKWNKF